jgi:class 3 adenylate cyclase
MAGLPSGTLTFLFTDIEGSTTRWEQQPEAMQAALARHDALLRAAILEHGGHVVKTMGDAFHAAFSRAQDAVAPARYGLHKLMGEP